MYDLPGIYSQAVATAMQLANERRSNALVKLREEMDAIAAEFEAEVAAAGVALEAGMAKRIADFHGVVDAEPVQTPSELNDERFQKAERQAREIADRRFLEGAKDIVWSKPDLSTKIHAPAT